MRLRQFTAALATVLVASCGGDSGTTEPDTTVASVTVSGATTVAPQGQIQLTATAKNAAGATLNGLTATWSSTNTGVATVSATGLVTGVSTGSATIEATISGIKGQRQVNVQQVTVSASATVSADNSLSFQPPQVDISVGGQVTWNINTSFAHNVTFAATAGAPANIPNETNASVTRTFTTAGTFTYNCTNHPGMSGTVVVHQP